MVIGSSRSAAPKFLLFESLPQTLQPSEFVIFVVKGYREIVSYSGFPWKIISGLPSSARYRRRAPKVASDFRNETIYCSRAGEDLLGRRCRARERSIRALAPWC